MSRPVNFTDRLIKKRNGIYKAYTILFILMCILCYGLYLALGRTFIWSADGWNQHYKALIYYSRYLREIIRTLFTEFRLVIPQWDFNIGEGSDIIQTLHYYVIGDPFNILCFLVPTAYMHIYFDMAILLRIYAAGLFFIMLIRYEGINNPYGILAGALNYCFCQYVICMMSYHPYFLNPMVFLPLLVLGVEKVLYERRYSWMAVSVTLAAVSNIYFFYINVILTAVFVVIRVFAFRFRNLRDRLIFFCGIAVSSLWGVLMGAVILLPSLYGIMNDSRLGAGNRFHLFYPLAYYLSLPKVLIMQSHSTYELYIGVSAVAVLVLAYKLITGLRSVRKDGISFFKNNTIVWLTLVSLIFVIFPFFGQLMNGMTYRCNRWSFALVLLISYAVAKEWSGIIEMDKRDGLLTGAVLSVYLFLCFFIEQSRDIYVIAEIALSLALLVFIICIKGKLRDKQNLCFILLLISLMILSHHRYSLSVSGGSEIRDGINYRLNNNEATAIRSISERDGVNEPFRYAAYSPTMNAGMLEGMSSTNFFFSNANPHHVKYEKYMGVSNDMDFFHIDYNERPVLLEMAAVRYFASKDETVVPSGYSFRETYVDGKDEEWQIYENDLPLGLTYSYPKNDGFLEEEVWGDFTETLRQETMLRYALIGDDTALASDAEEDSPKDIGNVRELDYHIDDDHDGIVIEGNTFFVLKDNAVCTIHTDADKDRLLYFNIENVSNEKVYNYDLYHRFLELSARANARNCDWKDCALTEQMDMIKEKYVSDDSKTGVVLIIMSDAGIGKAVSVPNPDSSWYSGNYCFAVDLGEQPEDNGNIYVRFPSKGVYTIEDIRAYSVDRSCFEESIGSLSQVHLDNIEMDTNRISGDISCDSDRLLCFSIPYLEGWSAYIDGQKTEILNANILYMGIFVPEGDHRVVLKYNTPFFKTGAVISLISCLLFLLYYLKVQKRPKLPV